MCLQKQFLYLLAAALFTANAESPFSVMDTRGTLPDKDGNPIRYGHAAATREKLFPFLKRDHTISEPGFLATFRDLPAAQASESTPYPGENLRHHARLVSAKGDYLTSRLMIFLNREMEKLEIKHEALRGPGVIPAESIRFLAVIPRNFNPRFKRAHLLLEPRLTKRKAGEIIDLLMMIDIPETARAGIYKGKIRIVSGTEEIPLDVTLRVMDFQLPETSGSFGFYLNGNFWRKDRSRIVQKGFTEENLDAYFRFYRTRRLNSVTLYDNLPDLRWINGKVSGHFTDISRISAAMKKASLKGKLILDLRDITYWCNAVALALEKRGGKSPAGDLGVTMAQRKSSKADYPDKAKEIFEEVLRHLKKEAEREQWTDYLLLVEEEIGNRYPVKLAGYASFMPLLMRVAPERAIVVDNEIGYGRAGEVDRGAKDHVRYRQYNSWTREALKDAEKDHAEILLFNYNPARLSFGFLPQSMNARGNHQWADLWDAWNFQWQYTRLSEDGVISSLEIEQIHEGCVDYAACEYLRALIRQQEKSGNHSLAEKGRAVLRKVTEDLPCSGSSARNLAGLLNGEALDARRWQVFLAIEELLHNRKPKGTAIHGKPSLRAFPAETVAGETATYRIDAKIADGVLEPNAENTEKFWSRTIGPLRYLPEQEARLKAFSSSEEEYRHRYMPSWSIVKLAALPEGMAVFSEGNHVTPGAKFRSARKSDDGDLWKDDCFELFFGLPGQEACRLIFNASGAKTFLRNGLPVPSEEILTYTKSPINKSGGTAVKLLVPWKYFGLKERPVQGTVWQFNACREFHTYGMILSWARVSNFHQQEKWGILRFGGGAEQEQKIDWRGRSPFTVNLYLNKSVISGTDLEFSATCHMVKGRTNRVRWSFRDSSGTEISGNKCIIPSESSRFAAGTAGLKPGKWELILRQTELPESKPEILCFEVLPAPCP